MTPAQYARARRILMHGDPVLAALITRHGPCGLAAVQRSDHFSALVRAITNQQLSTKAAATIYGRLAARMPDERPTPAALAALGDEDLRAIGYSRQKISYLRDLSKHAVERTLDLDALEGAAGRGGDRGAHRREGDRPLVGRDVPDVPASSA